MEKKYSNSDNICTILHLYSYKHIGLVNVGSLLIRQPLCLYFSLSLYIYIYIYIYIYNLRSM